MPPALMERIEGRLGVEVQTSWGMTELSPLGTAALPGDPTRRAALSGRPAIGIDLLITDVEGAPLAEQRGTEGHLRVRGGTVVRSEEHTSELQSLMRISYAVFCLKKQQKTNTNGTTKNT